MVKIRWGNDMAIKKEPIKDKEFELYLRTTYRYKLEEELLKTSYGRRIIELEKLRIGVSLEDVLDKYQERNGYTIDKVGNVKIEEDSIGEIYKENIAEASKKIGFDISDLDAKQISQVLNQLEYVQDVRDIRIDGKNYINRIIQTDQEENNLVAICERLNIEQCDYSLDKNSMIKILSCLNISDEQAKDYVKLYEEDTLDTFLSKTSDAELINGLAIFSYIFENNQITNLEADIESMQMILDNYCSDSKFLKNITDKNGKFDLEKGLKFFKIFKKKREESDLAKKINRYSTKRELTENDEKKLVEVFVVASDRGNEIQIKSIIAIAQTNGIDILDKDGKLDRRKIEEYGKKVYGKDFSFNETLEENSFEGLAAMAEIDRIKESISRGHTKENPITLEEADETKKSAKKNEMRICSAKEKIVYDVLNSQNFYKNPEKAEQLILLFCKFRDEEIIANNPQRIIGFNEHSINTGRSDTVSGIIKKYMIENKEIFSEYLRTDDKLDPKKVMKVIESNELLSATKLADNLVAYEQIKSRNDEFEMLERRNGNKEKIRNINNLLEKSKKDGLSDEEKAQLYLLVKDTPVDVISTESLESLKQLDEEKFKKVFKGKKIVKNVGKDSLGAIYFSASKLLVKALYALPKMIINPEARKEYIPKIKKHLRRVINSNQNSEKEDNNQDERKDKRIGFLNIFKKNKPKQLETGKPMNLGNSDRISYASADRASEGQKTFNERYSYDNTSNQVEKNAVEEFSKKAETHGAEVNHEAEQTFDGE